MSMWQWATCGFTIHRWQNFLTHGGLCCFFVVRRMKGLALLALLRGLSTCPSNNYAMCVICFVGRWLLMATCLSRKRGPCKVAGHVGQKNMRWVVLFCLNIAVASKTACTIGGLPQVHVNRRVARLAHGSLGNAFGGASKRYVDSCRPCGFRKSLGCAEARAFLARISADRFGDSRKAARVGDSTSLHWSLGARSGFRFARAYVPCAMVKYLFFWLAKDDEQLTDSLWSSVRPTGPHMGVVCCSFRLLLSTRTFPWKDQFCFDGEASNPGPSVEQLSMDVEVRLHDVFGEEDPFDEAFNEAIELEHIHQRNLDHEPPCELEVATLEEPKDAGTQVVDPPFVSSAGFKGFKEGMVFRRGDRGQGYYVDVQPSDQVAGGQPFRSSEPVTLVLDVVVPSCPKPFFQPLRGKRILRIHGLLGPAHGGNLSFGDSLADSIAGTLVHPKADGSGVARPRRSRLRCSKRRLAGQLVRKSCDDNPEIVLSKCIHRLRGVEGVADDSHRRSGMWAIDVVNPNCWYGVSKFLERTVADAVLALETRRITGRQVISAQMSASRSGWRLALEPADPPAGPGPSKGGAGVAVKKSFGLSDPAFRASDPELAHRFRAAWWGAYIPGGVYLASAYLWSGEGASDRNMRLLTAIARFLNAIQGSWILAADFQMSPATLASTGWLGLVNGYIFAPDGPTSGANTLLYFVTSARLRHAIVGTTVLIDGGFHPHCPVRLFLRPSPRVVLTRALRAPAPFDKVTPFGPLPCPTGSDEIVTDALEGRVNLAAARWMEHFEAEISSLHKLEGNDMRKHTGRSQCPRFVWVSALGRPTRVATFSTVDSRAWRTLHTWLSDLHRGVEAADGVGRLGTSAYRALARLRRHSSSIFVGLPDLRGASSSEPARWMNQVDKVRLRRDSAYSHALSVFASRSALSCEKTQEQANFKDWRAFVLSGPAQGLGRQHKFSKDCCGWVPSTVSRSTASGKFTVLKQLESDQWASRRVRLGFSVINLLDGATSVAAQDILGAAPTPSVPAPLTVQGEVDAQTEKWATVWLEGTVLHRAWGSSLDIPTRTPSLIELRRACNTFKVDTGTSWEGIGPKVLSRCSDEVLTGLIALLTACEVAGSWPSLIRFVVTALLLKPDGTYRAIGLFHFIVRVWGRVTRPDIRAWEKANDREYIHGGVGRSAESAAWRQGFLAEAAMISNACFAEILLDLIKAFDFIGHAHLIRLAALCGYPMKFLRLSIASYLLPRTIAHGGVYSRLIFPQRGAAAGSCHATAEMRVMTLHIADELKVRFTNVALTVLVDDVTLAMAGTDDLIKKSLVGALQVTARRFEELDMELSRSKCQVLCSSSKVALHIKLRAGSFGVVLNHVQTTKLIGSPSSAGNKRAVKPLWDRLRQFRKSIPNLWSLKRAGVSVPRLLRTGGTQRFTYGQSTFGVAPTLLHRQRQTAAMAMSGGTRGKSLDLSLLLADEKEKDETDPMFAASKAPIVKWAEAVWHSWWPVTTMDKMVSKARVALAKADFPWMRVVGPSSAFVATAARIGWTITSARFISCENASQLDLTKDPPVVVANAVHRAVRRWQMENVVTKFPALGASAHSLAIEPIRKLIKGPVLKFDWHVGHAVALKSAVVGGQWTQERLHTAGMADDASCKLCAAYGSSLVTPSVGTCAHRLQCPIILEELKRSDPRTHEALQDLAQCTQAEKLLNVRGLLASSTHLIPPRGDATFVWIHKASGTIPIAMIYTDGSALDSRSFALRRMGWAFVAVSKEGDVVMAAAGATPSWVHDIGGAEAWALFQAVREATPGSTYLSDSLTTVEALTVGQAACSNPKASNARALGLLHASMDEVIEARGIDWMPAHLAVEKANSVQTRNGCWVSAVDILSNALADSLAKEQATHVRVPVAIRKRLEKEEDRVLNAALLLGKVTFLANNFPGEVKRDACPVGSSKPWQRERNLLHKPRNIVPPQFGGHSLIKCDGRWKCFTCRKSSTRYSTIASRRCAGSAAFTWAKHAALVAEANQGDSGCHVRVANGTLIWCRICGHYAQHRAIGLSKGCLGPPDKWSSRAAQLRRLLSGHHPKSNELLRDPPVLEHWDADAARGLHVRWRGRKSSLWGPSVVGIEPVVAKAMRERFLAEPKGISAAAKRLEALRVRVRLKRSNTVSQSDNSSVGSGRVRRQPEAMLDQRSEEDEEEGSLTSSNKRLRVCTACTEACGECSVSTVVEDVASKSGAAHHAVAPHLPYVSRSSSKDLLSGVLAFTEPSQLDIASAARADAVDDHEGFALVELPRAKRQRIRGKTSLPSKRTSSSSCAVDPVNDPRVVRRRINKKTSS